MNLIYFILYNWIFIIFILNLFFKNINLYFVDIFILKKGKRKLNKYFKDKNRIKYKKNYKIKVLFQVAF